MKQKLYFFLSLMMLCIAGASPTWAATQTIYSWVSSSTDATGVTETGGTAAGRFGSVINYCMQLGDRYSALKTNNHIIITLADNATFQEGDVITIKGYYSKDATKEVSLAILPGAIEGSESGTNESSTSGLMLLTDTDWPNVNGASTLSTKEHSYTLNSNYTGKNAITLTRNSSSTNLDIASVVITREVDDPSNPATPFTTTFSTANIKENGSGVGSVDGILSLASVALSGDNVTWNGTLSYNNVTYGAVSTANTTTANDKMTFTIYPKKGITFKPTKVSFGAIRSGTNGGKMTVKANSTTLTETAVPGRNSSGKEEEGYTFSYNLSNLTVTKTAPLTITIAMVGMTGTRGWGVADLVVEGTYTGTAEDGEMYSVVTSVNIDGAGTVEQNPTGTQLEEETSVTFKAKPNTGYTFVNWTDDNNQGAEIGTNATYSISSLSANTAITANFKALTAVSFDKGNSGAYGEVPATQYGDGTVIFTIPANQTLLKDGYTLTNWEANGFLYGFLEYSFNENTTLTPQFTQNNVTTANFPAESTVTWNFGKSNGAPSYTGAESANVKQVAIGNETIDLGIKMAGGSNEGRNDEWLNTQGKDFIVPVTTGAVIKAKVYYASGSAKFGNDEIAYDASTHGSQGNVVYTYTYTGEEDALTVNVGSQFLSYISVTYPFVEQRQPSDLSLNLPAESVTLTADASTLQLNPTSSATVALTYKSDNPLIASVDEKGLITAVANGTTVITVSQKGDAVYQDDSKSVNVTVNNGVIPSYSVEMILNNETGSILTSEEQVQGTQVSFGINAANERVAADADDAVVVVNGNYWNDHGFNGVTLTVKATGNMKFTIGNCTYNKQKATITNANNEEVASTSLSGTGCWKGTHTDVTTMYYEGEATTLTFSNPSYCPYLKVESVGELQKNVVTFRAVEGAVIVAEKMVIAGEAIGKLPTAPAEAGMRFRGWYEKADGSEGKISANTVPSSDVTYYAIFMNTPVTTAGYYTPSDGLELANVLEYIEETSTASAKIFLKNGTYTLPRGASKHYSHKHPDTGETLWDGNAYDPITYLKSSNVSFIGQSRDGVVITNNVPNTSDYTFVGKYGNANIYEGIGCGDVIQIAGSVSGLYWQDLTVSTGMADGYGRDIAIQDKGTKNIYKNVGLHGYQDTWTSNNDNGLYYFEGGVVRGRTDYLCGKGDIYFNGVELRQLKGGYAAVPSKPAKIGWVFKNCVINGDDSDVDGNYTLGRPWGNGTPVAVFIDTKMNVKPSAIGWNEMSGGWPARFAEYNSVDANDNAISLSGRKTTFASSHANNPVLTEAEAATYSDMDAMYGDWNPTQYTVQATVENVTLNDKTLSWESEATAFLIEKDGAFVALTEEKTYDVSNAGRGIFTVRAANARGGFGEAVEMAGAGTLTWNIATGTSATALTSTQVSTIDGLITDDMTAITADAADAAGKDGLSVKLNCGTAEAAAATVTFTVPEGYAFIPYSASAKVQPISKPAYVKVALGDVASAATSLTAGQITEVVLNETETRQLTGTVTLGIYCYDGANSGVTTYRLGTPVTVTGQLVELPAQSVTVSISNAGWATLYTDKALDFSQVEGLTAYTATVSDNTVTLKEATEIGSDAGVVLHGEAGEYDIPVLDVEPNTAKGQLTGNATEATAYNEFANYQKTIYILASVNDGKDVQFVPCISGSVAAKKAFLVLDTPTQAAKAMKVVFASETTGISNVNVNVPAPVKRIQNGQLVIEKNGKTYNAAGQLK